MNGVNKEWQLTPLKMKSIKDAIRDVKFKDRPKNLTKEFQVFGVYLAESLQDTKHYSLYMKLAKEIDRKLLEEALNFCKGYNRAKSKARLFMWKLKELKAVYLLSKQKDKTL